MNFSESELREGLTEYCREQFIAEALAQGCTYPEAERAVAAAMELEIVRDLIDGSVQRLAGRVH